ncbi:hypothetical protein KCU_11683, partial [Pasteurella multocida subsp. multocida str. P52VAC]
ALVYVETEKAQSIKVSDSWTILKKKPQVKSITVCITLTRRHRQNDTNKRRNGIYSLFQINSMMNLKPILFCLF